MNNGKKKNKKKKNKKNKKKNMIFVEANVINISTKFQLHPRYGFWGNDFFFPQI